MKYPAELRYISAVSPASNERINVFYEFSDNFSTKLALGKFEIDTIIPIEISPNPELNAGNAVMPLTNHNEIYSLANSRQKIELSYWSNDEIVARGYVGYMGGSLGLGQFSDGTVWMLNFHRDQNYFVFSQSISL